MEAKTSTLCADNEREVKIANKGNEECAENLAAIDDKSISTFHIFHFVDVFRPIHGGQTSLYE